MNKKKRNVYNKDYKVERDQMKLTIKSLKEQIAAYKKALKWYATAPGIYCNERAAKILKEWK